MFTTHADFLAAIDAFRSLNEMSETAFGRAAVGDPNFVHDVRAGRMPGLRLIERVSSYINANPPKKDVPSEREERVA